MPIDDVDGRTAWDFHPEDTMSSGKTAYCLRNLSWKPRILYENHRSDNDGEKG